MNQPKKWTEVYPHGTKEGDEESRFFRALARHPKYDWRSTGAIVKKSGLSPERVEEIISKYISCNPPLIFPSPSNEGHWGYWERVPDELNKDDRDLSSKDKDSRIDKHMGGSTTSSKQDMNKSCSSDPDDPQPCSKYKLNLYSTPYTLSDKAVKNLFEMLNKAKKCSCGEHEACSNCA